MNTIFKSWVPEWLIKLILFSGLMPSMVLFFLPAAHVQVTAGFYGCQPSDVQFLIVLFYSGFVGFYVLERRFFEFVPTKTYYIIFNLLQIVNCLLMSAIKDIEWIYPLRFFQGMVFASAVNLSISMIFSRLKSESAKEGSYAIFFGMLLCSSPFNTFVTADFIDSFNFDELYVYAAWSFFPGLILVMVSMHANRHRKAYPLWSLDWASFVLYSLFILAFGYMMVYGQEVYWLHDHNMLAVFVAMLFIAGIFSIRQQSLKRVYIHLQIFKSRKFLLGLLILYIMYIERFSLTIANQYFVQELGFDPIHLSVVQWFNIVGIVTGVLISFYWLIAKRSVKYMWSFGFCSLIFFHQFMFFSFENDGNEYYFYLPLLIHGLGVGLIMVPTILFVIASVKKHYGVSAAAICLAVRYFGYTSSIAFQNFFKLMGNAQHQEAFGGQLQVNNPLFKNYLTKEALELLQQGMSHKEQVAAIKLLAQYVRKQSFLRFAMDYYEMMSLISIVLIMIILFFPSLKTMYTKLKKNMVSPA